MSLGLIRGVVKGVYPTNDVCRILHQNSSINEEYNFFLSRDGLLQWYTLSYSTSLANKIPNAVSDGTLKWHNDCSACLNRFKDLGKPGAESFSEQIITLRKHLTFDS